MRWNLRLITVLMTMALVGSSLAAEEPRIGDKPVAERKNEGANPDSIKIPDALHYLPDQVYYIPDEGNELMLDILRPKAAKGPLPTVICVNGGGWVMGSRKTNLPIMKKLAEAGYAAVSVQYRLAQQAPFPAAVNDVKCAVRWLRANGAVFNLDADRFAALGYSAGGNMACLLGLTTPLDGLEGKGVFNGYPSDVQVVISYAGISDLADWYKDGGFFVRFALNGYMRESPDKAPKPYGQGSPMSYARGDMAAVLLIHGTKDEWVPLKQSEKLEKALKNANANVQLLTIKDGRHNLEGDAEKEADAAALKFLDENLRSKRAAKGR
jgi:acetyl esterase/lipase